VDRLQTIGMRTGLIRPVLMLLASAGVAVGCHRAVSGGQSGDEGNLQASPSSNLGSPPLQPPFCRWQISYGPESRASGASCVWNGEPFSWNGEPTPAGPYQCDCPDATRSQVSDAKNCEDALVRGCQIDLNAPTQCASVLSEDGVCWPVRGSAGDWRCRCTSDGPLVSVHDEDCQEAWQRACSPSCSDDSGKCELSTNSSGHTCECTDGNIAEWPGVLGCSEVLQLSCIPECKGSRGACSRRFDGFECTCDEQVTSQFVDHGQAYGNCDLALEIACGFPPAGESCGEEDWNGATCTADGQGGWSCNCTTPPNCEPLRPNERAGTRGPIPGEENVPAPPAGVLDRPRSCVAAFNALCGCPR
jgi:hypothetical protein